MIAATVEEVIVLASDGVGVRVSVEPRTEDAEQPGMDPLLAATVPVPAGGRFNRTKFGLRSTSILVRDSLLWEYRMPHASWK